MDNDNESNNSDNHMAELGVHNDNVGHEKLEKGSVFDNLNKQQEDDGDSDDDEEQVEEEDEEEEEKNGGGEEERAKLDEGFFEIEAIRRRRVRKGQLQYMIKWRGWPETANTWEPLENLQSCSDFIDAFEDSLRSGKSTRRRKRKSGGTLTHPKKKQSRFVASYNGTGVDNRGVAKPLHAAFLNNTNPTGPVSGHGGENNGDVSIVKTTKKADDNGHANGSRQTIDEKEDNEYDPKLSELRGLVSNVDVNADNRLAIAFHEDSTPGSNGLTPTIANGLPHVDHADGVQNSRRVGSRRRKSGFVKRFKKESVVSEPVCIESSPYFLNPSPPNVSVGLGGAAGLGIGNGSLSGSYSSSKPVENSITITKIIKPIGFSASMIADAQDVLVTFFAMRSDGKEVIVDNRFLKANNPLLLIDFYEQHLRYST